MKSWYQSISFLTILFLSTCFSSRAQSVPSRWPSADPASLTLLDSSPINCLLQESPSAAFVKAAQARKLRVFAILRPSDKATGAQSALATGADGIVLEGDFEPAQLAEFAKLAPKAIRLAGRYRMSLNDAEPIVGTWQGVWPGLRPTDENTHASASGAAWIDTNTGFLRFARSATKAELWIANRPPTGKEYPVERYLQAIGDAAMTGSSWVIDFDAAFWTRLFERDATAIKDWARVNELLRFYQSHPEWRQWDAGGQLALVEDATSGALLSGGVLDMIAVKHTPVRPVPATRVEAPKLAPVKLAVNVDPEALNEGQKDVLKRFTAGGGTLLTGPPGWKFPQLKPGQITLEKEDLDRIDQIWKELNSMIGRRNLGARLFNVASVLSNLLEAPDGKTAVLHLVNYSDYPVENVTVHVLGEWSKIKLLRPGRPPISVETYSVEDGTGVDLDVVGPAAALLLEK